MLKSRNALRIAVGGLILLRKEKLIMLIVKIVWLIAEIAKVWQKETKLMKISWTSLIKKLM